VIFKIVVFCPFATTTPLTIEQFDRHIVNKWLKLYASGGKEWEEFFEEVIQL